MVARLKAFNFCRWGKRRKARGPIGGRKPVRSLGLGVGLEVLPFGGRCDKIQGMGCGEIIWVVRKTCFRVGRCPL